MKRTQDTPLLARSIKRVRKGVYEIRLEHPSRRKYGYELFWAPSIEAAKQQCLRLYPSTVFVPKRSARTTKRKVTPESNNDSVFPHSD